MESPASQGLSHEQACRRLRDFGPNRLPEPTEPGPMAVFGHQFLSPFIYILLAAAVISFAVGQHSSAIFILAVLSVNAIIGTVQEVSAQRSASALRDLVRGKAHVIRDGLAQTIDAEAVVPGDRVLLYSGDRVPADMHLHWSQGLVVDESMLTGESLAVTKNAESHSVDDAPLGERFDHCFAGAVVIRGRAEGLVTRTGLKTEIGRIARRVGAERRSEPPLMIRIRRFTYSIAGGISFAICALVGLMWLKGGYDLQSMLTMSIGLAVSAIPEGLPAALTVALAIGMRRMAQDKVVIRKLIAVEGLGSCTFICSDKTGTLTVNQLTIKQAILPDGTDYHVGGEGVRPGGTIESPDEDSQLNRLRELCVTGVLANESHLDYAGGEWASDGDIVDVAFLVFAKKLGMSLSGLRQRQRQIEAIPYESERAFSASLNRGDDGQKLYVKGSPEKLLELCSAMQIDDSIVEIDRAVLERRFDEIAQQGFRLIALAQRHATEASAEAQLGDLVFLGVVAMIDPVRPEAKNAVQRCRNGGVGIAMVTGDHPQTARAIAKDLGLIEGNDATVVTGPMLKEARHQGNDALDSLIRSTRVFARIEPTQKEEIVDSFMRAGHFVAVTGDGVNDAPAMRRANTGVAMGKSGTDVAKEAADLIITDDNFASLVDGIEQGRIVYANIRKVIALLIATGFSALTLFFLAVLAGLPMPLIAVQLLWLNLVANGFQDVALAFERKEGHELERPPRRPDEPIFEKHIVEHVLVIGGVMAGLAFAVYWWLTESGYAIDEARNLVLMLMVLFGNIHALSARSESRSLFSMPLSHNVFLAFAVPAAQLAHIAATFTPGLSDVLQLEPVSVNQWLALALVAMALLAAEEAHKWTVRYRARRANSGDLSGSAT